MSNIAEIGYMNDEHILIHINRPALVNANSPDMLQFAITIEDVIALHAALTRFLDTHRRQEKAA